MKQNEIINEFCKNARYHWIKFESKENQEFGKILTDTKLNNVNLSKHEIHKSIDYNNGDRLFTLNLMPDPSTRNYDNQIKLLLNGLAEARVIEMVYQNIFRWAYDGLTIKGYAIVPSGDPFSHPTISRYGGTEMFMKILRQHLKNIGKMTRGITPDYDFLSDKSPISETELSIGSFNQRTSRYSIGINLSMDYTEILKNSNKCISIWQPILPLVMKYWTKEINPDFISEAKHIKLNQHLTLEEGRKLYPQPIKKLMSLKDKGNYNRFLIARFLLSVHVPHDAKFAYYYCLSPEELEQVKGGNCSTQWNFIQNNLKKYDCPSIGEVRKFCDEGFNLNHLLEDIQAYLEKKNEQNRTGKRT